MHSPESTTSGLGIALRGGNGVVLPLRAWARASIYLLVGGIERKAGRYRIRFRIPESREEGKLTGMTAFSSSFSSSLFQWLIGEAKGFASELE